MFDFRQYCVYILVGIMVAGPGSAVKSAYFHMLRHLISLLSPLCAAYYLFSCNYRLEESLHALRLYSGSVLGVALLSKLLAATDGASSALIASAYPDKAKGRQKSGQVCDRVNCI